MLVCHVGVGMTVSVDMTVGVIWKQYDGDVTSRSSWSCPELGGARPDCNKESHAHCAHERVNFTECILKKVRIVQSDDAIRACNIPQSLTGNEINTVHAKQPVALGIWTGALCLAAYTP